ncbi:MAG: helix-turn-helix domain-containing protein [Clostridiales bacterium]|nr:helix-turn-helix domain-containing protein [Clostridiales bacterium]
MLHFKDVDDAQKLCESLAAPARVEIMKLVLSGEASSLDSLAKTLHLTNGAITQHVKKLCEAGLIKLVETPGKRGVAKRCVPVTDRVIIDIASDLESENESVFDLPIGAFSAAAVKPYCAIATADGWIGERDDPRYFTYPDRVKAALIYFNSGRLTYTLPAPSKKGKLVSLALSFEISSKPYGHGHERESEVEFRLNDVVLGAHVIGGEYTDRKGLFTPPELGDVCCYGKYKTVKIDGNGTFFDGIRIGAHTIDEFDPSALAFSLSTENGIALFGNGFGDYDSGINVHYFNAV